MLARVGRSDSDLLAHARRRGDVNGVDALPVDHLLPRVESPSRLANLGCRNRMVFEGCALSDPAEPGNTPASVAEAMPAPAALSRWRRLKSMDCGMSWLLRPLLIWCYSF